MAIDDYPRLTTWLTIIFAIMAIGGITVLKLGDLAFGQQPPVSAPAPAKYTPTEVQSLRLQLKHKDAELAQIALQTAQAAFQRAMSDLSDEGKRIKTDNHWPDDVQFDPNQMTFSEPPPPAPAKSEVKKP